MQLCHLKQKLISELVMLQNSFESLLKLFTVGANPANLIPQEQSVVIENLTTTNACLYFMVPQISVVTSINSTIKKKILSISEFLLKIIHEILTGNILISLSNSPDMKLFLTSDPESISKGKDFYQF